MGFWDKVKDAMSGEDDSVRRQPPAREPEPEPAPPVREAEPAVAQPAVADDVIVAVAETPVLATYTVQLGDTLEEIASRHDSAPDALAVANELVHRDRIYPGLVLQIPSH